MILLYRPIKNWPDGWTNPRRERVRSPFSSTWTQTRQVLERELWHLGTEEAQLQLDVGARGVNRDQSLRADAKVTHPGVILTLESTDYGRLTYSCDAFTGAPSWHENLRAIALGLEALRKVERYGIASRGEQYAGYKEIGTGIPLGAEPAWSMTHDEAATFMARAAGMLDVDPDDVISDPDVADAVYRLAAKRLHPDHGGDEDAFKRLGEARRVVAAAYRSL